MFGVIMSVGPGQREVDRMHDTLAMVAAHEAPAEALLVLVDDDRRARNLAPGWPNEMVIRTQLRQARTPDIYSAMTAGTLSALDLCRHSEVDVAIKLDTDAAVIGPFSAAVRRALADPAVGVVGSYDRTSTGAVRDWTAWTGVLAKAGQRRLAITRRPDGRRVVWYKRRSERQAVRAVLRSAAEHAPVGAHCLGGAYAVSRGFLDRAELAWRPWTGSGISEDVVVGALCAAAGLEMRSLVGRRDPFALAWQGLPGTPEEIAAGGHSIVHSVKAGTIDEERRIRGELARLSSASSPDG
jgi:hypothetical protein